MNRLIILFALLLVHVLAVSGRRSTVLGDPAPKTRKPRKSKRRGRRLADSSARSEEHPPSRVFERRLRADDVTSTTTPTVATTKSPSTTTAVFDSSASSFISSLQQLSDVSVWRLVFEDGWDNADDDLPTPSGDAWTPGYLMMTKLNELHFDKQFINNIDPQCLSSESTTTTTTTTSGDSSVSSPTISINTTLCPSFDIILQVVNTMSTRLVFTPDGKIIPFEIFATDMVGSINNMDMESQVLDALTYLWSIEFGNTSEDKSSSESYDVLVFNEMIEFDRIHGCTSVQCFGSNVFANTASFWSLDAFRKDPESSDWDLNMFNGVGVWMQMINDNDQDTTTASFSVQPQHFGVGPITGTPATTWKVDLSSGTIADSSSTVDQQGETQVLNSLDQLKSIVSSATSVTFDLSEVPWSVQITSATIGEAVLYISYCGESF